VLWKERALRRRRLHLLTDAYNALASSIAATIFEETPAFFSPTRSESPRPKRHVPSLILAMMMSSSKPILVRS